MIGKAAKTAARTRTGRRTGKLGAKTAMKAGKVGYKAGKGEAKLMRRALSSREPAGARYLKYGLFTLAGFAIGSLVSRLSARNGAPTTYSEEGVGPSAHSEPGSGPLIGEQRRPEAPVATGQQEEVEQRIRTRIGEDPRTQDMPRVNVEVNDGVAELRGSAPTEAAREAAGEIAASTEGVREVRNLITVSR